MVSCFQITVVRCFSPSQPCVQVYSYSSQADSSTSTISSLVSICRIAHEIPTASSLPPIELLYRLRKRHPEVFDSTEGKIRATMIEHQPDRMRDHPCAVYIDGELFYLITPWPRSWTLISFFARWRASRNRSVPSSSVGSRTHFLTLRADVVKALCLGARAVGLGRPFLYAQTVSLAIITISLRHLTSRY